MHEAHQFYVSELQPFVSRSSSISRERGASQRPGVAEVRSETDTAAGANATLYGSTQLAVDLAELAAEAGDDSSVAGDDSSVAGDVGSNTCSQTVTMEANEAVITADEHSGGKMLPVEAPIALDGFCLQSCSVGFVRIKHDMVFIKKTYQPIIMC